MTNEDKIKVLAELDGWKFHPDGIGYYRGELTVWTPSKPLPLYLTSYDAIIPLVQKQPRAILVRVVLSFKGQNDVSRMVDWLQYTPEQLADALIKAVGKWKE